MINFDWMSFNNLHIEGNNWCFIGSPVCTRKRKEPKLCAVKAQKDTYASVNGSSNAFLNLIWQYVLAISDLKLLYLGKKFKKYSFKFGHCSNKWNATYFTDNHCFYMLFSILCNYIRNIFKRSIVLLPCTRQFKEKM